MTIQDAHGIVVHDIEVGDRLPNHNDTVCNKRFRTERLGVK